MHIVEIMLLVMGMNVAFWLVALDRARSLKASGAALASHRNHPMRPFIQSMSAHISHERGPFAKKIAETEAMKDLPALAYSALDMSESSVSPACEAGKRTPEIGSASVYFTGWYVRHPATNLRRIRSLACWTSSSSITH